MRKDVYKNYLLGVLLLIFAFNQVDRLALGLLLQAIKVDLQLSDTQLGFLSGIAFALFYSILGVPIARWADRGNRVVIISISCAMWSAAVALCALAGNFMHLLLIRIGVAIGEAGCVPPAHSLIADYFNREERPRAMARYMLGAPLSGVIGYFAAGWLNEFYGWRLTFVLLGLPGLVLAFVAWFTLKEPRIIQDPNQPIAAAPDAGSHDEPHSGNAGTTYAQVAVTLWGNVTFRHLLICFAVVSFFGVGISKWLPVFFVRSYGMSTGELGTWFAVIFGLGNLVGIYLGGEWATRLAATNESLQIRVMAGLYCLLAFVKALAYMVPTYHAAFALMALAALGSSLSIAPIYATIQTLVPPRMRAMAVAIIYLFANLIGLGLGPLAAGILSDALRPAVGEESLRYALIALCPGYLWGAFHLWRASKTVASDLKMAQESIELGEEGRHTHRAPVVAKTGA
jgi:MFS family permease